MPANLSKVLTKAARLHDEGRVHEVEVPNTRGTRRFTVEGDSDTYTVTVPPEGIETASCTCPARVTCSHLYAVAAAMRAERNAGADPFARVGGS